MNTIDYTTKDNLWISEWTHPTTGETRYYLNDWEEDVAGLEVYRRKSGSISEFYIRDEKIANGRYGNFGGKVWVSATGEVHVELSRAYYETASVDGDAIEADLREAARQLWEAKYAPAPAAEAAEDVSYDAPIDTDTLRHPNLILMGANTLQDGENWAGARIAWKSDTEYLQIKPLGGYQWEISEHIMASPDDRSGPAVSTTTVLEGQVDRALRAWLDS